MKQLMLFVLLTALCTTSCKKEPKVAEIKYEVILTNATSWHGAYIDKYIRLIGITNATNNWTYTFKNDNDLQVVTLQAYPDGTRAGADALMRIYVNGTVVAEERSSVFPQVQYQF